MNAFIWPFVLTSEEIAIWAMVSERMRKHLASRGKVEEEAKMSDRPTHALEWALQQGYPSVSARYAKEIATYTVQLEAEIAQLKEDQAPFIAQITQRKAYPPTKREGNDTE